MPCVQCELLQQANKKISDELQKKESLLSNVAAALYEALYGGLGLWLKDRPWWVCFSTRPERLKLLCILVGWQHGSSGWPPRRSPDNDALSSTLPDCNARSSTSPGPEPAAPGPKPPPRGARYWGMLYCSALVLFLTPSQLLLPSQGTARPQHSPARTKSPEKLQPSSPRPLFAPTTLIIGDSITKKIHNFNLFWYRPSLFHTDGLHPNSPGSTVLAANTQHATQTSAPRDWQLTGHAPTWSLLPLHLLMQHTVYDVSHKLPLGTNPGTVTNQMS